MFYFENTSLISLDFKPLGDKVDQRFKNAYQEAVKELTQVGKVLLRLQAIVQTTDVPEILTDHLIELMDDYSSYKISLDDLYKQEINLNSDDLFRSITSYVDSFFEISSSNYKMLTVNAINSLQDIDIEKQRKDLLVFSKTFEDKSVELDSKIRLADEILLKLENPSAEKVLSTYASIYDKEATDNNGAAKWWLGWGVSSTMLFITGIYFSIKCQWFEPLLKLTDINNKIESSHEIINIPILVTKVMLVSLIVFVIVFCFKQYSIYKNLSVMSKQKKNAFESYRLFEAAIGDGDAAAKNALLSALAKSIYESGNTGFLSKDNVSPSIQNIDIGKLTS